MRDILLAVQAVVMLLAALVLPVVFVVPDTVSEMRAVLGLTDAMHGTATVLSCRDYGRRRTRGHDCKARFAVYGSEGPPLVVQTIADVEVGETFPATTSPLGDYIIPTGTRGVWRLVATSSVVLFTPALVLICIGFLIRGKVVKITGIALALVMIAAWIGGAALGS